MKIFGYSNSDDDNLMRMAEVSIQCTAEEVDKLIEFFKYAKSLHSIPHESAVRNYHSHLRDWDKNWNKDGGDIILVFN